MAMKKWNFLYWLVFPLGLWIFYLICSQMESGPDNFIGYAESRYVSINLPVDVMVDSVFVQKGDIVSAGSTLIKVTSNTLDLSTRKARLEQRALDIRSKWTYQEIKSKKAALISEMESTIAGLESKRNAIRDEVSFYQSLLPSSGKSNNPQLAALESEIQQVRATYAKQLKEFDRWLSMPAEETVGKIAIDEEIDYLVRTKDGFVLKAPFDGIVSDIILNSGIYAEAFSHLVTLSEKSPGYVTAYMDERYHHELSAGDSVTVSKTWLPEQTISGVVRRKGAKIIEIPEKYRQVPSVKQYGVEVFIEIPAKHAFLEKEVLKISVK